MPVPAGRGFLSRYTISRGITLFRADDGHWFENPYPTLSELKVRVEGTDCLLGGRVYYVDDATWDQLYNDGFIDGEPGYGEGWYGYGPYGDPPTAGLGVSGYGDGRYGR